ncbi:MAG: class I SAM-dependent methyltransferase [Gemmatimonadota bacterium]
MAHQHTSVSSHLGIPLHEYDARIRTFVPYYEDMLDAAAACFALAAESQPTVLELGIGTGALTERCRRHRPATSCIGIDMDHDVLTMAKARLGTERVDLRVGSYLDLPLPEADFIVASLSLHHVQGASAKRTLYSRCRDAVRSRGMMIIADCFLPQLHAATALGMKSWQEFLEQSYTAEEAGAYLKAWASEDTYFPLADELDWLSAAGFKPDVIWRRDLFGVIAAG